MLIDGKYYQSIWFDENEKGKIMVIDQQKLPFFFETKELCSVEGEHTQKECVSALMIQRLETGDLILRPQGLLPD